MYSGVTCLQTRCVIFFRPGIEVACSSHCACLTWLHRFSIGLRLGLFFGHPWNGFTFRSCSHFRLETARCARAPSSISNAQTKRKTNADFHAISEKSTSASFAYKNRTVWAAEMGLRSSWSSFALVSESYLVFMKNLILKWKNMQK